MSTEFDALVDRVAAITGKSTSREWLLLVLQEGFAHLRRLAPCQKDVWLTPADLPADVETVLVAAASRRAAGPADGIVSETIGDYTYTRAGANNTTSYYTDEEVAIINDVSGCGSVGAIYSVAMNSATPSYGSSLPPRSDSVR